jgi:hypothetical protein
MKTNEESFDGIKQSESDKAVRILFENILRTKTFFSDSILEEKPFPSDYNGNDILYQTMTVSEIEERWELPAGSVRRDIDRGKFRPGELMKSGKFHKIMYLAAKRVYGEPKKDIYS